MCNRTSCHYYWGHYTVANLYGPPTAPTICAGCGSGPGTVHGLKCDVANGHGTVTSLDGPKCLAWPSRPLMVRGDH